MIIGINHGFMMLNDHYELVQGDLVVYMLWV